MEENKQLKDLFEEAKLRRTPFESEIREAYYFSKPSREFMRNKDQPADTIQLFDATAVRCARNLVTNIIRLMINPNVPFAEIIYAYNYVEARLKGTPTEQALVVANRDLHKHFSNSNFYMATTEGAWDLVVAGSMVILIVDMPGKPLTYAAIPLDQCYFLEDYDGSVNVFFREHEMTLGQMVSRWGRKNLPNKLVHDFSDKNITAKHTVRESVIPNGAGFEYSLSYGNDWKKLTDSTEQAFNPFIVSRWEKGLGNVWGESPTRAALPHIRTVNTMVRDIVRNGDYAANGLWQIADEGVNVSLLRGRMKAGDIVAIDTPIQPIPFPGRFDLNFEMVRQEQEAISRLMFDSTPPPGEQLKYMTAEAVIQLRQEFFNSVGEPAQRLQREFLQPIAQQVVLRLYNRGELTLLPFDAMKALNLTDPSGRPFTHPCDLFAVSVNAALTKALSHSQASDTMNAIANVGALVGPQQVALHIDMDKATNKLLKDLGVPEDLLRSDAERKQMQAAMEQIKGMLAQQSAMAASGIGQRADATPLGIPGPAGTPPV